MGTKVPHDYKASLNEFDVRDLWGKKRHPWSLNNLDVLSLEEILGKLHILRSHTDLASFENQWVRGAEDTCTNISDWKKKFKAYNNRYKGINRFSLHWKSKKSQYFLRYQLEGLLGKGGFGSVYQVDYFQNNSRILKSPFPSLAHMGEIFQDIQSLNLMSYF